MSALELKVPPLAVVLALALAMFAIATIAPSATFKFTGQAVIAAFFACSGTVVALAGVWSFRRHQTTVNPLVPGLSSSLVADGIYRTTRNPMYVGFFFTLLGWAFLLSNALAAVLLPCFVVYMNRYQIAPEERALEARFGPEYVAYKKRVRRWL